MANKLVIVALSGFAVAVGGAVVALSLGGPSWSGNEFGRNFAMGGLNRLRFEKTRFGRDCGDDGDRTPATRSLAWTDQGDGVDIDLVAKVNWAPGNGAQLQLKGPKSLLDHVRLEGNRVTADCLDNDDGDSITVILPGRVFTRYQVSGVANLDLAQLNQPELDLDISGAASVHGAGVVPNTRLDLSGASAVDLQNLITQNLKADVSGVSKLTANPAQSADIDLSGAGFVDLLSRPRQLHSDVSGIGRVNVPDETEPAS